MFWFLLFEAVVAPVFVTDIVPLTYMYALLWSHKFDLIVEVWNLICSLTLYTPRDLSFFSTQFLVLNLEGSFVVSSNNFIIFWFFIIILLYYYYINLRSLIICCCSSGDI